MGRARLGAARSEARRARETARFDARDRHKELSFRPRLG
jgi:hypothetical protein